MSESSESGDAPVHTAPRRDPDETVRAHSEDPAEGPDTDGTGESDTPRVHPQDPAEG